jgi:quercetin dioxygenase-like cupin family protein
MLFEQIETACIHDVDVPWIPFTPYSEHVLVKYFKLDPIRGETIALLKAPAIGRMPKHHHTGTVIVYTVQGRWKYQEHEWIASKGSVVYEVAGSSHTPQALPGNEDIVTLNIIQGELLYLNEQKQVIAIENWRSGWDRYAAYCKANNLEPRDLTAFN